MVNVRMTQPFAGFLSLFSSQVLSTISPFIILAIAGFFAVIGVVLAFIFEYHWTTYGLDKSGMLRVRFWYYIGTIVFGGGMLLFALLYVFST
jgi:hypothetical protein